MTMSNRHKPSCPHAFFPRFHQFRCCPSHNSGPKKHRTASIARTAGASRGNLCNSPVGFAAGICAGVLDMCSNLFWFFKIFQDGKKWNDRQNNNWPNGNMVGFTYLRPVTGTGSCEAFQLCWWGRDTDDTPRQSMKHIDTWYTNGKETQRDNVWLQGLTWKAATLWPKFCFWKIFGV